MVRILLCGSAVLDFVFHVTEMPRAPEKYRAEAAEIVGGGVAANAAVAVARLGGAAHLFGRRGDDAVGRLIGDELAAEGVDIAGYRVFPGARSAFSSIYIDAGGERQIMSFRGDGLPADATWLTETVPEVDAVLTDTRWPAGAAAALRLAARRGIPGVLDAEAGDGAWDLLPLASHIAFSRQGLADFAGTPEIAAGLAATGRLPGFVCVTDGAGGAHTAEAHHPGFAVHAIDTLAAGDVWHGAFTLRLAEGAGEGEAIRFAHAAAALKCTRPGGRRGTPDRAETDAFL
ncbi:MAG: PfkB family carbohydrate kinase, partial [Pseudomonadota bacterium]